MSTQRCRYCDKPLGLFARMRKGFRFCSDEHHALYQQSQQSNFMTRLAETGVQGRPVESEGAGEMGFEDEEAAAHEGAPKISPVFQPVGWENRKAGLGAAELPRSGLPTSSDPGFCVFCVLPGWQRPSPRLESVAGAEPGGSLAAWNPLPARLEPLVLPFSGVPGDGLGSRLAVISPSTALPGFTTVSPAPLWSPVQPVAATGPGTSGLVTAEPQIRMPASPGESRRIVFHPSMTEAFPFTPPFRISSPAVPLDLPFPAGAFHSPAVSLPGPTRAPGFIGPGTPAAFTVAAVTWSATGAVHWQSTHPAPSNFNWSRTWRLPNPRPRLVRALPAISSTFCAPAGFVSIAAGSPSTPPRSPGVLPPPSPLVPRPRALPGPLSWHCCARTIAQPLSVAWVPASSRGPAGHDLLSAPARGHSSRLLTVPSPAPPPVYRSLGFRDLPRDTAWKPDPTPASDSVVASPPDPWPFQGFRYPATTPTARTMPTRDAAAFSLPWTGSMAAPSHLAGSPHLSGPMIVNIPPLD